MVLHPSEADRLGSWSVAHPLRLAGGDDCDGCLVVLHHLDTVKFGKMRDKPRDMCNGQSPVDVSVSDSVDFEVKLRHDPVLEDVWLRVTACSRAFALLVDL